MCRVSTDDLVYGLKRALRDPGTTPETRQRLQSLLDRWEAQHSRPDQDAATRFLDSWENDRPYALLILSRMDARDRLALAQAVAAHQGTTVGWVFVAWKDAIRDAIRDAERKPDHSTHPTMSRSADYTTR